MIVYCVGGGDKLLSNLYSPRNQVILKARCWHVIETGKILSRPRISLTDLQVLLPYLLLLSTPLNKPLCPAEMCENITILNLDIIG